MRFGRSLRELDPADASTFSARFGDWDPGRQRELLAVLIEHTPTTGVYAARSGCEVSAALGTRLGIDSSAIAALGDVNERWDGRGIPDGRAGDQVDPGARIVQRPRRRQPGYRIRDLCSLRARRHPGHSRQDCADLSLGELRMHDFQVLDVLAGERQVAVEVVID